MIASIFDLLGYFAPTVLEAKLFMKGLWIDKCNWDERLEEKYQFWSCWKNDYLLSLRERGTKKSPNYEVSYPKVGEVILIKDNLPRGQWRVGKISELIKGRDERVRSVKVTVAPHKVLHRALNMLYPLECYDPIDSQVDKPTSISETENNCDGRNEGDDMNDDVSTDDLLENSTSRPTRKAMIAARKKIQR